MIIAIIQWQKLMINGNENHHRHHHHHFHPHSLSKGVVKFWTRILARWFFECVFLLQIGALRGRQLLTSPQVKGTSAAAQRSAAQREKPWWSVGMESSWRFQGGPAIGGPKAVRYSKSPVLGLESSSQSWNILEVINMLIIVDEEANNSGHFWPLLVGSARERGFTVVCQLLGPSEAMFGYPSSIHPASNIHNTKW